MKIASCGDCGAEGKVISKETIENIDGHPVRTWIGIRIECLRCGRVASRADSSYGGFGVDALRVLDDAAAEYSSPSGVPPRLRASDLVGIPWAAGEHVHAVVKPFARVGEAARSRCGFSAYVSTVGEALARGFRVPCCRCFPGGFVVNDDDGEIVVDTRDVEDQR